MHITSDTQDRIYGAIFGQAIGDALGFGTEFLRKEQVAELYPEGLTRYEQITRFQPSQDKGYMLTWSPGDWTDDTDQMLCILDSLLEHKTVNILDIAKRFHHWAVTDGMGLGATVKAVVEHDDFLRDPHAAARTIWEQRNRRSAANGGVMRTSILGVWRYWNAPQVQQNARDCCLITHADPRCVGSAIAVSLAISQLIQGETDTTQITQDCFSQVADLHPTLPETLAKALEPTLESLDLDEGVMTKSDCTGYTLKTLGAGFWALLHSESFEQGLMAVINEAGDADTNGAVAGALLGAKFGYSSMPDKWTHELVHLRHLGSQIDQLIDLMEGGFGSIDWPPMLNASVQGG